VGTSAAGAVVLVRFPFSDLSRSTMRPAIVLADAGRGDPARHRGAFSARTSRALDTVLDAALRSLAGPASHRVAMGAL
jgi:hypothetical protein